MIVDILGNEVNIGDECILTVNNCGLIKVRITKYNKTSLYYELLSKPLRKVNKASYVLLDKVKYNIYKL